MYYFLVFILVYGTDIFTKILVRSKMFVGEEIVLLPFFSLTHVKNTGVAFGLFQGMNHVFLGAGVLVASIVAYIGITSYSKDRFFSLILAGVLGGALGNLTDRVLHGQVTDFLDFYLGSYHWPVFNVADSSICVGAGLLFLHHFRTRKTV
jgi:signal peptidase II